MQHAQPKIPLIPEHNKTVFVPANLFQVFVIHVVTFAIAPFYFSWAALGWAVFFLFFFAYPMGIFHHMYFTHKSFRAHPAVEFMGALLGTLTWRGPFAGPLQYVAMHRVHHDYADTEFDPHTPNKGVLFALLTWFWQMPYGLVSFEQYKTYVQPEWLRKKWLVFMDQHVHLLQLLWALVCFAVGGLPFVIYGVFVRAFLTIYLVNAVDVVNHGIGYRNYEVDNRSTNSLVMATIHAGGAISWHNNHHAYPDFFTVKRRWWEYDAHYRFLQILQSVRLVGDIKLFDDRGRA